MTTKTTPPPTRETISYTTTTTEIVVHRSGTNFAYGQGATRVCLDDEAGGAFIVLRQDDSLRNGEIRLDVEEIDLIQQAAKTLLSQTTIDS